MTFCSVCGRLDGGVHSLQQVARRLGLTVAETRRLAVEGPLEAEEFTDGRVKWIGVTHLALERYVASVQRGEA